MPKYSSLFMLASLTLPLLADSSYSGLNVGPFTVGGALRANYVKGDYAPPSPNYSGAYRGATWGDVELDTVRINIDFKEGNYLGKLEYRWYDGYSFIHTAWVGYTFEEQGEVKAGVVRVPFGPGAYGVSKSWFFDQHYYVGLSDDMDLGVKYTTTIENLTLDFAYFYNGGPNGIGTSAEGARYGYDVVPWQSSIAPNGDVSTATLNGWEEKHQFNLRAIYDLKHTKVGLSLLYGGLEGYNANDGTRTAISAHMENFWNHFTLSTQLTWYKMDIDNKNLLHSHTLAPMGGFDFTWPVATQAWLPAASLSYKFETPNISWLDYALPYIEYSSIIKDDATQNNSDLFVVGSAWSHGNWYIYTDLAYSNGNFFVGDLKDDYTNIYDGVGDFGSNGNTRWNYRFNLNMGYYF